ncbi:MAG: tetratricopeptide repeat protein, partial [Planctomycetota bacterium]
VISAFVTSELLHSRFVLTKGDLQGEVDSTWVLASKAPYAFDNAAYRGLSPLELRKAVYWTDDYCSLAAVLRPQQFDLTLARRSFNASITEGIAALDRNDLESAESAFRRAVADDDRDAGAWLHLGNTLRRKGVVLEAIECYRRAIELNEGYSEAHANLGALVASADPQLAERHIRRAIEIDPRNAEAYNSLANLTVRRGELREAIPLYEQALAIKPSLVSAQQNLALVRATLQQGDTNR